MRNELVKKSRLLSFLLRHDPGAIGLTLDANGWAIVSDLIKKIASTGRKITPKELLEIVATNDKKRFELDTKLGRIRANQGHTIEVDIELPETCPPEELFHGTALRSVASILSRGLLKQRRQFVHLSPDIVTARAVGSRHGTPVVLRISSGDMSRKGYKFYLSKNGVWLTDLVPPQYLARL